MKRNAFTLIEVLASMAVLMILTLSLSRMFLSASDITSRGMTSIARNSVAESAMESILSDLDCMVINERIACCKIANDVEDLFDTIYFIGTNGDNDDDMPYEYFNYYVKPSIVTNTLGAEYMRFDLVKARVIMAVGAKNGFYALREGDTEWWDKFDNISKDEEVLAENVVSFDVYCRSWKGGWSGNRFADNADGGESFYSTRAMPGTGVKNLPPVSFDVQLKVTSPEAAVEGGMLLASSDQDTRKRGWELLNREATTLYGRAMPMMGASQYRLQLRSAENPVKHYYTK